jgi:Domain of unknown function (DUF4279)
MMDETYPELYVTLELASPDIPPSEITERLGLQPTKAWRAGDADAPLPRHRENVWILRLPARPAIDFADLVEELLLELDPSRVELVALAQDPRTSARLKCVGYMTSIVPAIYFENELLARISALRVDLDVDLFQLPDDSHGPPIPPT